MTKSLNDILKGVYKSKVVPGSTGIEPGVDYAEKSKDGREFVAKHKVEKHEDRVGNSDEVYNASKVKQSKDEKHGHTPDPKAKTAYKQHNEAYLAISQKREPAYNSEGHYKMTYAKFGSKDGTKEVKHTHIKFPEGEKPTTPERVKNLVTNSPEHKQLKADGYKLTHYGEHAGEATIKEAKDAREYDYEGEMAISQIKSIMNHSEQLMSMLKPNTNLPEWVQSKITLAKDYIQTAADYYATEMTEASKCNMSEAGTMCEIHGMSSCGSKKEEKDSVSDKEPRYNGKKKEGRQLITDKKLKEEQVEEREMSSSEKKKEDKLKSKYDDSDMKASMQKQYGDEKGKQVYFAYIRKKAMKSEQADTHIKTPSGNVGDTGRV
jgi:hypothetical protein